MAAPARVFVYGTLMPAQPRWPSLEPFAIEVVNATAVGALFDTGLGYPAALFGPAAGHGEGVIPGVCVTLDQARAADAIAVLDRIEAEGSLYRRLTVATSAGEASSYEWLGSTDGMAVLADGWVRGA